MWGHVIVRTCERVKLSLVDSLSKWSLVRINLVVRCMSKWIQYMKKVYVECVSRYVFGLWLVYMYKICLVHFVYTFGVCLNWGMIHVREFWRTEQWLRWLMMKKIISNSIALWGYQNFYEYLTECFIKVKLKLYSLRNCKYRCVV